MDDTYVWGESPEYVQQVLTELEHKLLEVGLCINAKKTHVVSNRPDDPFRFIIGGASVTPDGPSSIITILGAPVTLTGEAAPIVAEMQARSRRAFQAHRRANSAQLLQIRTMVGGERSPTEGWQDWHIRTMRKARALMHKHKITRMVHPRPANAVEPVGPCRQSSFPAHFPHHEVA